MVDLLVENAMPGDEVTVRENRRLRVQARAWGRAECSPLSRLEIVRHGEVVASRSAADSAAEDGGDLRIDAELEAGHGFWVAARAIGKDGTAAHTTPVYVIREGLRFWKYDLVNDLIAKRMASLKEVEDLIGQCRAVVARGDAGGDRAVSQLAAQGDELMKRVEAARDVYRHLLEVAGKEGAARAAGR
jgi:hypothetical protein